MKLIVAVDNNWGIGYKGNLLQRIPEDMKRFRKMTTGNVIIMGRETFYSLPNKSPLKDRVNIVLSKDESFTDDRIIICRSIDDVLDNINEYNSEDLFIIGGESIYTQFLPYCDEAYITKINNSYTADKYFPNLDEMDNWSLVSEEDINTYNGVEYKYTKYINNKVI